MPIPCSPAWLQGLWDVASLHRPASLFWGRCSPNSSSVVARTFRALLYCLSFALSPHPPTDCGHERGGYVMGHGGKCPRGSWPTIHDNIDDDDDETATGVQPSCALSSPLVHNINRSSLICHGSSHLVSFRDVTFCYWKPLNNIDHQARHTLRLKKWLEFSLTT